MDFLNHYIHEKSDCLIIEDQPLPATESFTEEEREHLRFVSLETCPKLSFIQLLSTITPWDFITKRPILKYDRVFLTYNVKHKQYVQRDGSDVLLFQLTIYAAPEDIRNQFPHAPYYNKKTQMLKLQKFNKKNSLYYVAGLQQKEVEGLTGFRFPFMLYQADAIVSDNSRRVKVDSKQLLDVFMQMYGKPVLLINDWKTREPDELEYSKKNLIACKHSHFRVMHFLIYEFQFLASFITERRDSFIAKTTATFEDLLQLMITKQIELIYLDRDSIPCTPIIGELFHHMAAGNYVYETFHQALQENSFRYAVVIEPTEQQCINPFEQTQQLARKSKQKSIIDQLKKYDKLLHVFQENGFPEDEFNQLLHFIMYATEQLTGYDSFHEGKSFEQSKVQQFIYWLTFYFYICYHNRWLGMQDADNLCLRHQQNFELCKKCLKSNNLIDYRTSVLKEIAEYSGQHFNPDRWKDRCFGYPEPDPVPTPVIKKLMIEDD